ncbi:hypothetical protein ACFL0J_05045 [Candidatus Neomarinimicrobiota bacterium]
MESKTKRINWIHTLFCQVSDIDLYNDIWGYADSIGCGVVEGEKNSADFIAFPAFMVIIDRNLILKDDWDLFLAIAEEVKSIEPCIVIDDNQEFRNPVLPNLHYLKKIKQDKIEFIKKTIYKAHKKSIEDQHKPIIIEGVECEA